MHERSMSGVIRAAVDTLDKNQPMENVRTSDTTRRCIHRAAAPFGPTPDGFFWHSDVAWRRSDYTECSRSTWRNELEKSEFASRLVLTAVT
jgi:hypothetical protein